MKPEIKRKWVKALLSGKYKQTRGVLKDRYGGFCCLGVLRDCMNPEDQDQWTEGELLSLSQSSKFGLHEDVQEELAKLNDYKLDCGTEASVPFEMIAGLIDETL